MLDRLGELKRQEFAAQVEQGEALHDASGEIDPLKGYPPEKRSYLIALRNLVELCKLEVEKQTRYLEQVDKEISLSIALGYVVRAGYYDEPKGKWGYYLYLDHFSTPSYFHNLELLVESLTAQNLYYNADTGYVTGSGGVKVGHIEREER
jgi:hypothetical protein